MDYRSKAICCIKDTALPEMRRQFEECGRNLDEQYKKYGETEYFFAHILVPGHIYEIGYPRCVCPEALSSKVTDHNFCECSRQSIIYILENLLPDKVITVETVGTVVGGADKCSFKVTVDEAIYSERLRIVPMSEAELQDLIDRYKDTVPELSTAYGEMLENCQKNPAQYLWYTSWKFIDKNSRKIVGDAGFKGLNAAALRVEIGYGVEEAYQGQGFATEGVSALCRWALTQKGVLAVEAEAAPENIASQRVLIKNGFVATGKSGEEGMRYRLCR